MISQKIKTASPKNELSQKNEDSFTQKSTTMLNVQELYVAQLGAHF